jgi:hypothetical protein
MCERMTIVVGWSGPSAFSLMAARSAADLDVRTH